MQAGVPGRTVLTLWWWTRKQSSRSGSAVTFEGCCHEWLQPAWDHEFNRNIIFLSYTFFFAPFPSPPTFPLLSPVTPTLPVYSGDHVFFSFLCRSTYVSTVWSCGNCPDFHCSSFCFSGARALQARAGGCTKAILPYILFSVSAVHICELTIRNPTAPSHGVWVSDESLKGDWPPGEEVRRALLLRPGSLLCSPFRVVCPPHCLPYCTPPSFQWVVFSCSLAGAFFVPQLKCDKYNFPVSSLTIFWTVVWYILG